MIFGSHRMRFSHEANTEPDSSQSVCLTELVIDSRAQDHQDCKCMSFENILSMEILP